ncbi:MAG: 16S rRNA (uracil(1498)-N(3))-methyltransferase [Mycobacteriales bacterium]
MTPPMFRAPSGAPLVGHITLDGPEGHHAADVRRIRVGETIWLTDGAGARCEGVVDVVRRGGLDVTVTGVVEEPAPSPRLVAVQALAKGGRDEAAVAAMTEVGVDEIVAWSASRSIAKATERTAAKWQATADAAARQARRTWWPTVVGPLGLSDVVSKVAAADVALLLHESAEELFVDIDLAGVREVLIVVGPEGGITDDEALAMTDAGAHAVRLGSTVLRSSTAGVAALAAICSRTRWA